MFYISRRVVPHQKPGLASHTLRYHAAQHACCTTCCTTCYSVCTWLKGSSALRRSLFPAQSLFPHLSIVHTHPPALYILVSLINFHSSYRVRPIPPQRCLSAWYAMSKSLWKYGEKTKRVGNVITCCDTGRGSVWDSASGTCRAICT